MIKIIFEAHSTTVDNQNQTSSGHYDAELSRLGTQQSRELGQRYKNEYLDIVFCSDLQRSYKTAELAFGDRFPIVKDVRLRECDYGDYTHKPSHVVDAEKPKRISVPFPNGESYQQTTNRIGNFLRDLLKSHNGKDVMIIGHRATQYGLEYWINGVSIKNAVLAPWEWQPGWVYKLDKLVTQTTDLG